jgi:hypothetical protein
MKSLTQIIIRARSLSVEARYLNVEGTPYEDQAPIIEARQKCLAAYDDALKADSPEEAVFFLQVAGNLESKWNTTSEASMAIADPVFDSPPLSSRSRVLALELDFSTVGLS